MKIIADLHIHSKYSRACSQSLDLPHLDYWAALKGIQLVGTGDFTHPEWFRQISEQLEMGPVGLYRLRDEFRLKDPVWARSGRRQASLTPSQREAFFLLTSEISCIYSRGGKVRRVHLLVFAPSVAVVGKIIAELEKIGNLKADGRPILGLDAEKLASLVLSIDPTCLIVPAHAWTPWFSVFGSKSGFDSLEECFGEQTPNIFAIETGLSSDPPMNRRLSRLDNITLISNSDAHSLPNLGREANVFDLPRVDYPALAEAIKTRRGLLETLEFFPEEGKYHLDGHSACKIRLDPEATFRHKGLCPSCKKPLTIGVLNRVAVLADRPAGVDESRRFVPYRSVVPLAEIIADALSCKKSSKKVEKEYWDILAKGVSELDVLLDLPLEKLRDLMPARVAEGIMRVRRAEVLVEGGYDGVYGTVRIFGATLERQGSLL